MSFLMAEVRIRDIAEGEREPVAERQARGKAEWMAMLRVLGLIACLLLASVAIGMA